MSDLGLKKDPATELNLTEEIALTKIFRDIILEYNYNIIAYNICKDHVHIILVCQPEKLSTIVKTLKGRSSYMFQSNGFKPIGKSLWSQKFFFAQLDEFVFADTAKAPGYVFNDHYLDTATNYIESNRSKHKLPQSDSLKNTIANFTKTKEEAFASEYTGGFDVVIGNPPYVQSLINEYEKEFFKNNYFSFEGKPDLYRLFIEKGIMLLRKGGLYSYITPNSFLTIPSAKKLRDFIKEHSSLVEIVNFEGMVFKDANINTVIFNISKLNSNKEIIIINDKTNVPSPSSLNYAISNNRNIINNTDYIKSNTINIENNYEIKSLTDKIKNNSIPLSDLSKYTLGLQVYHNTLHSKEDIKNRVYHNLKKQNDTYVPEIGGKNLDRYFISSKNTEFVSFGDWCYNRPDTFFLSGKRIFIREIPTSTHLIAGLFEKEGVPNKAIIIVKSETFNMYSLLGIINSKLIGFYVHKTTEKGKQKLFPRISLTSIKKLPITINTNSIFSCLVENQHIKVNTFQNRIDILLDLLKSKFNLTKPSKKLQNWYELDFGEFLKELEKARKKAHKSTSMDSSPLKKYNALTLSEEAEWMLYFNEQKQKATALKTEIDQTDKDIDQMVYELYGLTKDEIKIVEDTIKN